MNSTHVTYTPRPDATPENGLSTLAAVYTFVLQCHANKNAAESSGGEDDGKGADSVPAKASIS
jgi:hypothetical protein